MVTVTQESLAARIAELEAGPRSLKEDYQLRAFRTLLCYMRDCPHTYGRIYTTNCCAMCGEKLSNG